MFTVLGDSDISATSGTASETMITVLGGFAVVVGGRDVTPTGVPALAIKALAVRGPMHAEEFIELLWPEVDPAAGRVRLRGILARLRRSCGELVERRQDCVSLVSEARVDTDAFTGAVNMATVNGDPDAARRALQLYGGDLLPFDTYVDWTSAPRQRLRRRLISVLDILAEDADARMRPLEAVSFLERAIDLEPENEDRYLKAAQLLYDQGRRGQAVMMMQRAKRVVDELQLPPSAAYRDLDAAIRGSQTSNRA